MKQDKTFKIGQEEDTQKCQKKKGNKSSQIQRKGGILSYSVKMSSVLGFGDVPYTVTYILTSSILCSLQSIYCGHSGEHVDPVMSK